MKPKTLAERLKEEFKAWWFTELEEQKEVFPATIDRICKEFLEEEIIAFSNRQELFVRAGRIWKEKP